MPSITRYLLILAPLALSAAPDSTPVASEYGRIHPYFERNEGQAGSDALFISRGDGYSVALDPGGGAIALRAKHGSVRLRFDFVGCSQAASVGGEELLEGRTNYYPGNDPKGWITGIPQFGQVRFQGIYPGVDLVWHASLQQLEYDLILQPDVDISQIRLRFGGVDSVSLADNGDLLLRKDGEELRQLVPSVWQQRGKEHISVAAGYTLLGAGEIGLHVAEYDRSLPLTIDPVLSYSTLLGGSGAATVAGIAVDGNGQAYVTGTTATDDLPGTSGSGGLFVAKLNGTGTGVAYVTYFDSPNSISDQSNAIAVDGPGNAYITGYTTNPRFPVTSGVLQSTRPGVQNAFVMKLNASGGIAWSTYLGGSGIDAANAIAVDGSGNAYVAGYSNSSDFPATAHACATNQEAFVTALNATGSALVYSTCIAGNGTDAAAAIVVDSQLNMYVAGSTTSTNLRTTNGAFQRSLKGATNLFVAKLVLVKGSYAISYLTYLGGGGTDYPKSIAIDNAGDTFVAGYTSSTDFPGAAAGSSPAKIGAGDPSGFVSKLNPAGAAVAWSRYLGGNFDDVVHGIVVDSLGTVYVAGGTTSANFPTTPGAFWSSQNVDDTDMFESDVFVTQISSDGSTLVYSGRLGSVGNESATGLARDGNGALYIAGVTSGGGNYPTTSGSYDSTSPGLYSSAGFVTKVDMTSPTLCSVSLSSSGSEVPGYGGGGSFNVTVPAGCPWEAVPGLASTWINMGSGADGTTSGTVSFTVGANSEAGPLSGTIYVGASSYTVTWDAWTCYEPVFNPTSLSFSNAGGSSSVSLTLPAVPYSCPWVATPSDSWIQVVSGGSGTGSGSIGISAPVNSFQQRSGTVTVGANSFPVTQAAGLCTANVSGPSGALPAGGATGSFQITTSAPSCQWQAYGTPSWMQLGSVSLSGTGSASLGFVVSPNTTKAARLATFTIAGQPVAVNQLAGPAGNLRVSYAATTVAGDGCCAGALGDGGLALYASLGPQGLAWRNGDLYVADQGNNRIRVITPDGIINTFAGGGKAGSGPASSVNLGGVEFLAFGPDGALYAANNNVVWKIANGTVSVFAGQGTNGSGDQLNSIAGLTVDGGGHVFVTDIANLVHEIRGGVDAPVAGTGAFGFAGDNGPASSAKFTNPQGLASNSGNIFVADGGNQRVRVFTPGGDITTYAGGGSSAPPAAGTWVPATSVAFYFPRQVAVDPLGNLYVGDPGLPALWEVTPGAQITNVLSAAAPAPPSGVGGITTDDAGDIYYSNAYVTKLSPVYSSAFCSIDSGNGLLVLSPGNGTTGVVTDPVLTWTTVNGATSYDVRLGTSNPPPLAGNVTCTNYTPTALAANKTYYWQVIPKGTGGLTASTVQSFTTLAGEAGAPTLTLNANGSGIVAASPQSPDGSYYAGTRVCLTAVPSAGWRLASWSGTALDANACLVLNVTTTVTANFAQVAQIQNNRSFVSTNGNDAYGCSVSLPCRTLNAALAATNSGGEIIVLDSSGYGPATITHSVTITAIGVDASITATSGDALIINTSGNVTINGLSLHGLGSGYDGILVQQVGYLRLYRLIAEAFTNDGVELAAPANLAMYRARLTDNQVGLAIENSSARAFAHDTTFDHNSVAGVFTVGQAMVISGSSAHYNGSAFNPQGGNIVLAGNQAFSNNIGINVTSISAVVQFASCSIAENSLSAYSVLSGSTVSGTSPGTNVVIGSTAGTLSPATNLQ